MRILMLDLPYFYKQFPPLHFMSVINSSLKDKEIKEKCEFIIKTIPPPENEQTISLRDMPKRVVNLWRDEKGFMGDNSKQKAKEYFKNQIKEIMMNVKKYEPMIICFSVCVWNNTLSMVAIDEIKKQMPEKIIICGGRDISPIAAQTMLKNKGIDITIRGEAEITFKELAKELLKPFPQLEKINGIIYRKNDKIFENPPQAECSLNDLPNIYGNNIIKDEYAADILEIARGCNFKCAYCNYSGNSRVTRKFSKEKIKEELEYISKTKTKTFYLLSAYFNIDTKFMKELQEMITKHTDKIVYVDTMAELVNRQRREILKKMNVVIGLGLQTINPRSLKLIDRPFNKQRWIENTKGLKKEIGDPYIYTMLGLPGDDLQGYIKTLKFAEKFSGIVDVARLRVLPGTDIYNNPKKHDNIEFMKNGSRYMIKTDRFSEEDLDKAGIATKRITNIYDC